jgi:sec-independent protein translocase protein TatA
MFGVGPTELIVVAFVGLMLFGNRLPSVMHSVGEAISQFKRGLDD